MKEEVPGMSLINLLLQCIETGLVPKGLKLTLEPTIGNQNQEFLLVIPN